jgi:hypothetical protein
MDRLVQIDSGAGRMGGSRIPFTARFVGIADHSLRRRRGLVCEVEGDVYKVNGECGCGLF